MFTHFLALHFNYLALSGIDSNYLTLLELELDILFALFRLDSKCSRLFGIDANYLPLLELESHY